MLIPLSILKKYVDINVSDEEYVKNFSLKSAEVDTFLPFCDVKGLKVGQIVEIKDHPDSNHLHITTVNTGDVVEDIVCGAPNVEVGKKVIVAKVGVKLPMGEMKKAVIRGVASNGMNCALEELGIDPKFQNYYGIYYLNDDAEIGANPLDVLGINDKVLEIELTPNRQDLLSVIGVAYDTKAMLNSEMHLDFEHAKESSNKADITVSTETENCTAYYSKVIKNVTIKESPDWLKGALMMMNIRPINNVVDITNYCLMVTGQPLHAFDYDQIKTKKIVVKQAVDGDKFVTLDEQERKLKSSDIVITDGEKPLCLAGIMGGLNSEVEPTTKNIFLEAATFNPQCIKETSKRLDLASESSVRFEKGINPEMTVYSLELAAKMLQDLADGEVYSEGSSFDNRDLSTTEVKVTLTQINKVLGRTYTKEEVMNVFNGLSFETKLEGDEFTCLIPKRRPDINTYQDLIEEVVRIDGYSKIETTIPESREAGHLTKYQAFVRNIRHILSYNLNETVTYSLTTKEKATYFDETEKSLVKLMMPLAPEREYMRHSLVPALLDVVTYNANRKMNDTFVFEIGRCYEMEKETPMLAIALSGTISKELWAGKKEEVDFFYLKGLVENLFTRLSIKNYTFVVPSTPLKGMHPGVSAAIMLGKEQIGFMGKLHPETVKELDVVDSYVLEINLEKLFTGAHPLKTVKEISKYPSITRDLALIVDDNKSAEFVISEIKRAGKRVLTDVSVFDLYKGQGIEAGKKQLALSLTFADPSKTLETQEVDDAVKAILNHLNSLGITLRA